MSTTEQFSNFSNSSFEKVWAMLQESIRKSELLSEQMKKHDEYFAQMKEQSAKTEALFAQTEIQMREQNARTDALFTKTDALFARTDAQIAETAAQMARTDAQMAKTGEEFGRLGNRFGEVIEHLVRPGAIERFNELGYSFTSSTENFSIRDPHTRRTLTELDIVLENGESVIVIEIKVEPKANDVNKHIQKMQIYREFRNRAMPNDSKKIYGAIAAAVFPPKVQEAALEAGFYVIVQSGDTVKIDVPEDFEPTAF